MLVLAKRGSSTLKILTIGLRVTLGDEGFRQCWTSNRSVPAGLQLWDRGKRIFRIG